VTSQRGANRPGGLFGPVRRLARSRRGATLIIIAGGSLLIFGVAGLALDSARGYLHRLRLVRAVDSAALMAAKNVRQGESEAVDQAQAAAKANGVTNGVGGTVVTVVVSSNAEGEVIVEVTARQPISTTFMRLFGIDQIYVAASAVAAVPPVDLVLVLDQSYSLQVARAWDDLQDAAKDFVDYFGDTMDKLGMVSYHIVADDRFELSHNFTSPIKNRINQMDSRGYTNTAEGLRLAHEQITGSSVRERSAKVVVFFTDGRPTAYRSVSGTDRIYQIQQTDPISNFRGYFNNPETLDIDAINHNTTPDGCAGTSTCDGVSAQVAYDYARQRGLDVASQIRGAGVLLYTIGLGDPGASPAFQPDPAYLSLLANVDGMTDSSQPAGRMYFAPSSAELRDVFDQVAHDLVVRLAQ